MKRICALCNLHLAALKDTQLDLKLRSGWPHSFRLTYTVSLTAKSLKTVLSLKNEDEDTFEFNTLLHTYFHAPVSGYFGRDTCIWFLLIWMQEHCGCDGGRAQVAELY